MLSTLQANKPTIVHVMSTALPTLSDILMMAAAKIASVNLQPGFIDGNIYRMPWSFSDIPLPGTSFQFYRENTNLVDK